MTVDLGVGGPTTRIGFEVAVRIPLHNVRRLHLPNRLTRRKEEAFVVSSRGRFRPRDAFARARGAEENPPTISHSREPVLFRMSRLCGWRWRHDNTTIQPPLLRTHDPGVSMWWLGKKKYRGLCASSRTPLIPKLPIGVYDTPLYAIVMSGPVAIRLKRGVRTRTLFFFLQMCPEK